MLSFPFTESRDNKSQGGRLGMCFNTTTTPFGHCNVKLPTTPSFKSTTSLTITTELDSTMTINTAVAGAVVGGIVGCLLVLALVLLLLALVWMTMKYKRSKWETHQLQQLRVGGGVRGEVIETGVHLPDNKTLEMNTNEAYISTTLQIPTEDNVAYVQTENDYVNNQDEYECIQ